MRPNPYLVVTLLFWGFNFVSVKLIRLDELSAGAIFGLRYFLQWLVLVLICVAYKLPLRFPPQHRRRLLLVGFLTMGVYMALFLEGTVLTRAADSAVILATMPIFTWLFAILFQQDEFGWERLVCSLVAFGGVALVVFGGGGASKGGGSLLGDGIVFVGGVVWSLGIVLARPVLSDVKPLPFYTMTMPGALPVVLAVSTPALLKVPWAHVSPISWWNLGQLIFGSGVVATVCYYRGIADLGAAGATAYQFFVPVLAAGFAWSLLNQPLHALQGLGVAILIAAMLYPQRAYLLRRRG